MPAPPGQHAADRLDLWASTAAPPPLHRRSTTALCPGSHANAPPLLRSDGVVDLKELDAGLLPKTRRKIEEKLDAGWKFDAEAWAASVARHSRWNMSKVMEKFDADGDNKLDIYELARAFRAIGLQKRTGEKMEVDKAMFKSFDTVLCRTEDASRFARRSDR